MLRNSKTLRTTNGTKPSRGSNFECVMSGAPIAGDYIMAVGQAGRLGARLMAIVAEGERGRVYLPPTDNKRRSLGRMSSGWRRG